MRAEVTADNTSIRVSWQWSRQGVLMCVNLVTVHYQPEGGSLMMYTVDNTTATSATLPSLQCDTEYTIWVYAEGGGLGQSSVSRMVFLPTRGTKYTIHTCMHVMFSVTVFTVVCTTVPPPAPPTPTGITSQFTNASSVRITWQWASSGPAPNCFNTTTVTYHPEGGGEFFLQLSDPAVTEATLTGLQCNTNYTITVVATAGEHRRERTAFFPVQGKAQHL